MSDIIKWENRTKTIRDDEGETFNSVKLVSKGFVLSKDDPNKDEQIYCALHI